MAQIKEGDKVKIIERPVTAQDKKSNRYFEHLANLVGTVQNIYGPEEIVVKVDLESLSDVAKGVHKQAVSRMREKFLSSISEEQKSKLTQEELNFNAHYVVMVRETDLQAIKA